MKRNGAITSPLSFLSSNFRTWTFGYQNRYSLCKSKIGWRNRSSTKASMIQGSKGPLFADRVLWDWDQRRPQETWALHCIRQIIRIPSCGHVPAACCSKPLPVPTYVQLFRGLNVSSTARCILSLPREAHVKAAIESWQESQLPDDAEKLNARWDYGSRSAAVPRSISWEPTSLVPRFNVLSTGCATRLQQKPWNSLNNDRKPRYIHSSFVYHEYPMPINANPCKFASASWVICPKNSHDNSSSI